MSATEQATHLARGMQLTDAASAKFIPLYIEYCTEVSNVFKRYPVSKRNEGTMTEAQYKANTENRFAIARAIIGIREKYYKKFTKILTAKQIDSLYRMERRFHPGPPDAVIQRD